VEVKSTAGHTEGPPEDLAVRAGTSSATDILALDIVPFEHYALGEEHARGGLGRIVRALDRRLDRQVAVKEILGGGQQAARRFVREARLTARLQHPSIVPVHEAGRWPTGEPFYAMKLVAGRSLKEIIDERASLDERLALLPNVLAVAEAIAYAHAQRVIHRDLKPSNVLVGEFGETVVVDWGLAKDLAETAEEPELAAGPYRTASDASLTVVGHVIGTPAYMPPEQARGEVVDERADVYALGALLYHVLAGRPPYEGTDSAAILSAVLGGVPEPLARRQPGVPRDLATIVAKAMARDPAARYPSARELADDLRRFQTGQLVTARAYSRISLLTRWMRRHAAPVAVGLVALVVLAVTGVLSVRRILREKGIADAQRNVAEARADELVLTHARSWLDRDPTTALAWLKSYPATAEHQAEARDIARDAASRGVARHVLRGHHDLVENAGFSPDGTRFVTAGLDGVANVWDVASGRLAQVVGVSQRAAAMFSFSSDSRWLAVTTSGPEITVTDLHGTTRVLAGHEDSAGRTVFQPGSHVLFSNGYDGTIRRWDLDEAAPAGTIIGRDSRLVALQVSSDGKTLAGFNHQGLVACWDVATGTRRTLPGAAGQSNAIQLAPDGRSLAVGGADGSVRLWNLDDDQVRNFTGHTADVFALAFAPDGRHLASVGKDRTVRVWDVATGEATVLLGHQDVIHAVAYAPGGRLLATASTDRSVRLWEVASGYSQELLGHTGAVHLLAFTHDGRTLASVADDGTARLWTVDAEGDDVQRGSGHYVAHAVFARDGQKVALADSSGEVWLWDLAARTRRSFTGHETTVNRTLFTPDGRELISSSFDHTVRRWDLATGVGHVISQHDAITWMIVLSPDGRELAIGDDRGIVRTIELATGRTRDLTGHQAGVYGLAYAPDGASLASASVDHTVRLWDLASGRSRLMTTFDDIACCVAFSPDGTWLASSGNDGTVRLTRVRGEGGGADVVGATRVLRGHQGRVRSIAFSPDGRWLASGGEDKDVRVWDVASGAVRVWRGHEGLVRRVGFSPAGDLLASCADDRTVRLWDLATGESAILRGHHDHVLTCTFSPDGARLVSTSEDGTARLWRAAGPTRMEHLRAWLDAATSEEPAETRAATPHS
jgi:WD40 repeat protein